MDRRTFLAAATVTVAGCQTDLSAGNETNGTSDSGDTYDQRPLTVSDWTEGRTRKQEPYSAVWVEATVEDPPFHFLVIGTFEDGDQTTGDSLEFPDDYGDHGSPLYDKEGPHEGWIVFNHPDEDAGQLTTLEYDDWEWTRE